MSPGCIKTDAYPPGGNGTTLLILSGVYFLCYPYLYFLSRGGGRMPEAKTIDLVDLVVRSVNPSLKQRLTHKHLGHQDPEA